MWSGWEPMKGKQQSERNGNHNSPQGTVSEDAAVNLASFERN